MEEKDYTMFQLDETLLDKVAHLIENQEDKTLSQMLSEFHYADIAEILDELSFEDAIYIIKLLDSETTSDILIELDEDQRDKILKNLSAKEIADEIKELDTDDAADIILELPEERQNEVIAQIDDEEHRDEVKELLGYEDDTAGSLMAKELVKVYETWTVAGCLRRIRGQAEEVKRVHSIYVVDKQDKLKGRLSLKDLIVAKNTEKISDIYISNVDYVTTEENVEEVAKLMQKYDLEAIPVLNNEKVLLGRITIDDIVDVIKEEAEKDYQLAAGITQEVEADDNVWELTKARLPWLILGLFGGLGSVYIMQYYEEAINNYVALFYFTPLIAAMAGNVGVQSSAIIVQGLANDSVKGSLVKRLLKEVGLALINGTVLGILVILFALGTGLDNYVGLTIAISMLSVIIVAALVGTFVPIILHKKGIDPAIATGPFITTSNDIFGIFLFFYISKTILGF